MNTFHFNGRDYDYYYHPYNRTHVNERCVELPLAFEFLTQHANRRILEVGNVTSHYRPEGRHDILDLFEKDPSNKVMNLDILTFKPTKHYDVVLSVSTVEHTANPILAISKILAMSKKVLITFPLGGNSGRKLVSQLKETLPANGRQLLFLLRVNEDNKWVQVPSFVDGLRYHREYPPHANEIGIIV